MTEYRWSDLAEVAAKEGKLGKIVAALCTYAQGQPGGAYIVMTDELEAAPKKKKR